MIKHETGIYEFKDAKRKKPFLWKQTISGELFKESFSTFKAAKKAKKQKLEEVKQFGSIATEFKEADWLELKQARERLGKAKLSRKFSVLQAVDYCISMHGNGAESRSLHDEIEDYLAFQEKRSSASHFKTLRTRLRKFARSYGDMRASEVSKAFLVEYLQDLATVLKPHTVHNYRSNLRFFFKYLVTHDRIAQNPMDQVDTMLLPKIESNEEKHPISANQVAAVMAFAEVEFPELAYWLALQFFVGFRVAESKRFRFEWVDKRQKRIVIPGWFYDSERSEQVQGTKTKDEWAMDAVPGNFWTWHDKYGKDLGYVIDQGEATRLDDRFRDNVVRKGILPNWPNNTKRDTFCTCHLSAFRDPKETALMLKHTDTSRLWKSYMGCILPKWEGRALFQIYPGGVNF
ncbi:phage integrase SAM-like domain-containing protein [Puniceicoccaceae bacterium K14]|nr:phage integrase SAM-like domain-containing protein [Puniceicoccaceae bacterium K14]